jgi:gluconolactonase
MFLHIGRRLRLERGPSGIIDAMVKLRAPLLTALTLLAAAVAAAPAAAAAPCANPAQVRVLSSGHGVLESIAIDSRGRLFFTDSTAGELLMLRRPGGRPKLILDGIDGPGGIVFQRHSGNVLVGFGDTIAQAADGPLNPEAGLLRVNPTTGASEIHTVGLQMANGVARGPGRRIYASIDIGGGIDRIRKRRVRINWADVPSANGMIADRAKRSLFVNQTFTAAAIQRVPFDDPSAAETYFAAGPADAAAGLDGLTRDGNDTLYAAANGAGEIWRIDGPGKYCTLAELDPFPSGPSDLDFGNRRGNFSARNLYVTTFGGELLELVDARR